MKTYVTALLTVVLCVCMTAAAPAQRDLSSDEVQQILGKLTSQPRDTWIPTGTIEATRREYGAPQTTDLARVRDEVDRAVRQYQGQANKMERTEELQKMKLAAIPFNTRYNLANEYTMDSSVTVKYDGQKFYWEIYINSRSDSVQPDSTLAGNTMTDEIDPDYNRHRVFVWDGTEYTSYVPSGKWAGVDAAGQVPGGLPRPLTAGLIPWGSGRYSYANLKAAVVTATELAKNSVMVAVAWPDGSLASFVLDPSRSYAVTTCTIPGGKNQVYCNYYGGYQQVGGHWVPSTILIERFDISAGKLLGSDQWTFTSIDPTVPSPDSFAVQYDLDTQIEYSSPLTAEPVSYLYSPCVDTRRLLADHLAYEAGKGKRPQNCATAAVGYVASALGKVVPEDATASLVRPDGGTTLASMKRLVESMGLYCRAVRTDLTTLQDLESTKAILYLPRTSHFIVLDSIEAGRVRIVDLSSRKFLYEQSVKSFAGKWSDGVALLVSSSPVTAVCKDLDSAALATVAGASGYSCTDQIQWSYVIHCSEPCNGYFYLYFDRYGCEEAGSGECSTVALPRYRKSLCIFDEVLWCDITWEWYYRYMLACD